MQHILVSIERGLEESGLGMVNHTLAAVGHSQVRVALCTGVGAGGGSHKADPRTHDSWTRSWPVSWWCWVEGCFRDSDG